MTTPILELTSVAKSYGGAGRRTDVLEGIDLAVAEGEFVAVLGYSGTGKTTLISLLAGLIEPDRGSIRFRGEPLKGPSVPIPPMAIGKRRVTVGSSGQDWPALAR